MIHLKVRTEYTFGQTYAPIPRVVQRLKDIGCTAAGIVDLNSTWGHVKWFDACNEAGIKPLLGVEFCVETDPLLPMWVLATDEHSLQCLYHIHSHAHANSVRTKTGLVPVCSLEKLEYRPESLKLFAGSVTDRELLKHLNAIIDLSPASQVLNSAKQSIAKDFDIPVVQTCDNAYAYSEDEEVLELIEERAIKLSPQYILDDITDTPCAEEIAKIANVKLPKAPMIRLEGDLEKLCREGIKFRGLKWTEEYEERLQHELGLIKEKDFESYFLVVADMVRYAKQHMLVGPSRGSAAGSLVCYLTRITEIDPLPPGLFFERFIDVTRTDLPDIDLDFPDNKRGMVFEYMADKYGFQNVAHIGTISEYKPKSALIQVCKKLGIPPQATGAVKAAMIERSSADSRATDCLHDTLHTTGPGKQLLEMYPSVEIASRLEGHASHTGVHAAGLLVCNEPLENFCTLTKDGTAQVDKISAEKLGLLKIDVLGLRTLTVLEDSGADVNWYDLQFDDPDTYQVFNDTRFCGIFQFEGDAMRSIGAQIDFSSLSDIDAVTALARPGPFGGGVTQEWLERREGKRYTSIHPLVEEHMAETYGLPVYQEQTLAIVREIGKFDWKETSTIRKAMSKRMGKEFFDKFWEKFKVGAESIGVDEASARKTWELINSMGAWQMNKAHTYSYAVISYWTAHLKAHYPLEFAAANLRNAKSEDSAIDLLREMVEEGFEYVPFDPELSEIDWSVKDGKLIGGVSSLKGFGPAKAKKYIQSREDGTLTEKQKESAANAENPFTEIFPILNGYKHIYANPQKHGVGGKVWRIADLYDGSCVFIGEIIYKNLRDANEEINVKKRGGKILRGPSTYLDLRMKDESGQILVRIDRYQYEKMGREISEKIPVGSHMLMRVKMCKGIRFGYVVRWRRLDA